MTSQNPRSTAVSRKIGENPPHHGVNSPNGVYDEQILTLSQRTNCPYLDRKNAQRRKGVDLCFNVYTSRSLIFTTMPEGGSERLDPS